MDGKQGIIPEKPSNLAIDVKMWYSVTVGRARALQYFAFTKENEEYG